MQCSFGDLTLLVRYLRNSAATEVGYCRTLTKEHMQYRAVDHGEIRELSCHLRTGFIDDNSLRTIIGNFFCFMSKLKKTLQMSNLWSELLPTEFITHLLCFSNASILSPRLEIIMSQLNVSSFSDKKLPAAL